MTIEPDGPCLQCLFPETPPEGCVGTCGETGVLGVLPLLFGTLQANEVLKGILGYGPTLSHDALLLDLRNGATTKLRRDKRIGCRGCLGEWEASTIDLTWPEAREMLGRLTLIDMRESPEFELPIAHIRMSAAEALAHPPNGAVALCCHRGVLSAQIAQRLRQSGRNDVYSLKGGAQSLPR